MYVKCKLYVASGTSTSDTATGSAFVCSDAKGSTVCDLRLGTQNHQLNHLSNHHVDFHHQKLFSTFKVKAWCTSQAAHSHYKFAMYAHKRKLCEH